MTGCALLGVTFVRVDIDGLADPAADRTASYRLATADLGDGSDDLLFREFAQYERRALDAQGFREAGADERPEILIMLDYSISDPRKTVHVRSSTRMENADVSATTMDSGGGLSTTTGTVQVPVTETSSSVEVSYTRSVVLEALDANVLARTRARRPWWKLSLQSVGSSGGVVPLAVDLG